MENTKIHASKSDKVIGWIFMTIGVAGVLGAVVISNNIHKSNPSYTIGLMLGGIFIRSLVPLLFIYSGVYYLSGKNAKRKVKKQPSLNNVAIQQANIASDDSMLVRPIQSQSMISPQNITDSHSPTAADTPVVTSPEPQTAEGYGEDRRA